MDTYGAGPVSDRSARAAGRDPVEAGFERLYRIAGRRYIEVMSAVQLAFVILVAIPGCTALLYPLLDHLDLHQYLRYLLAYELTMGLVGGIGMYVIFRRGIPGAFTWLQGHRGEEEAASAWRTISDMPRVAAHIGLWFFLCSVPPAIFVAHQEHFRWYGYPVYVLALLLLTTVVAIFGYLLFEQALRPIVREAAVKLPASFEAPPGALSLAGKILLVVPAIVLLCGMVIAAVARKNSLPPEGYLGTMMGFAMVLLLTVGTLMVMMFRNSLLQRIGELRRGMVRVDQGDLDVQIPLLVGDEIDKIGTSFNRMVEGLREREALREDLRASRARIVAATDEERRRMERDLHDGAQQHLVLLKLKMAMLGRNLKEDPAAAERIAAEVDGDLDQALQELRNLAHGIYPASLEHEGLAGALEEAAQRSAIPTRVESNGAGRYPPELEAAVYFCCLEALQNASKHAGDGAKATVSLSQENGELRFEIADDGRGFDASTNGQSAGLQNMADRIGALGGELEIDSAPGEGTRVEGTIPVEG